MVLMTIINLVVFVICLVVVITMTNKDDIYMAIFLECIIIITFIAAGVSNKKIGVEQGRMEVVTGKVKYELVTNSDSTRVWKEIKK